MRTFIALIQLLIFIGYSFYIARKFGILTSVSASSYSIKGLHRYIFMMMLWTLAGFNLLQGMGVYGFLTSAGLIFTGITINHNSHKAHTKQVHFIGTLVAILSSFAGLYFLHGMMLPTVIMALGTGLIWWKANNWIWWTENLAVVLIATSYMKIY